MKWIESNKFPDEIKQYHCKDHHGKPCLFYWTRTEPGKIYFRDQISFWLDESEEQAWDKVNEDELQKTLWEAGVNAGVMLKVKEALMKNYNIYKNTTP